MHLLAWLDRVPCRLLGHPNAMRVCRPSTLLLVCPDCGYESRGIEVAPRQVVPPPRVTRKKLPKPKANVAQMAERKRA